MSNREEVDPSIAALLARRGFVLASLGFLAACATGRRDAPDLSGARASSDPTPNGLWTSGEELPPPRYARPVTPLPKAAPNVPAPRTGGSAPAGAPGRAAASPPAARPTPAPAPSAARFAIPPTYAGRVIPRAAWTDWTPDVGEMKALGRVRRITVHHEGNGAFHAVGAAESRERLVNVLRGETAGRHLDIAYHYVIDRAGRVWEGRNLRYQGSHVRGNHANNMGIMCLGNFEEQEVSRAQLAALERFLGEQMKKHGLGRRQVLTHQELTATLCPGRDLQRRMGAMRARLA